MSRTLLRVDIGGRNVTSRLLPALVGIDVTDGTEAEADEARIILSDADGRTVLPVAGETVEILAGYEGRGLSRIFAGYTDESRSRGDAAEGRSIEIVCTSVDLAGPAKAPRELYWDDATLAEIVAGAFDGTGIAVTLDPVFASIRRDFEAMDGRDPLTFAADIAREIGATFKTIAGQAVFASRNDGIAVDGAALAVLDVRVGVNLVSWDLVPRIGRNRISEATTRFFDFEEGVWKEITVEVGPGTPIVSTSQRPGLEIAGAVAGRTRTASERDQGEGSIRILGDPRALAGGKVRLTGTRRGIDGVWSIASVRHEIAPESGWETEIEVATPGDGVGEDDR